MYTHFIKSISFYLDTTFEFCMIEYQWHIYWQKWIHVNVAKYDHETIPSMSCLLVLFFSSQKKQFSNDCIFNSAFLLFLDLCSYIAIKLRAYAIAILFEIYTHLCIYCGKKGDTNWLLLKEVLNEIKSI